MLTSPLTLFRGAAPFATRHPAHPAARKRNPRAGLTLIEVSFASLILTMVLLGVLQAMLQSRRMTEGSVRQASVFSLVQGYLEQLKSIKYGDLPSSPSTTPGSGTQADWIAAGNTIDVVDSSQNASTICLAVGTAPTSLPVISTLPTNASRRTEQVDIDNAASTSENSVLNMWVWINDLTGTNVVSCKSIVIVYQWSVADGGRVKYYSDMIRTVRSSVPTD